MKKELISNIGTYETVKITGQSLRVTCANDAQRMKLLSVTSLLNNEVTITVPRSVIERETRSEKINVIRGIVFGVAVEEELEDVKKSMKAVWVRRLEKQDGVVMILTTTIIFAVEGNVLPETVLVRFMRKQVTAYIPAPMRCYKCQSYGHKSSCQTAEKCPLSGR